MRKTMLALSALLAAANLAAAGDLKVHGVVESESGGFRFPDGTLQVTAGGVADLAQEVQVAKAGGHYTSIQAAIDSIADASNTNRYVVRVAPGVYSEQVTMKPYVSILGAGRGVTVIDSAGASPAVTAASQATLRDVSVRCFTSGLDCTAILNLHNGFIMRDIEAGVSVSNSSTPTGEARTLEVHGGDATRIRNSHFYAVGGATNIGIDCTTTTLEMTDVEVSVRGLTLAKGDNTAILCRNDADIRGFNINVHASAGESDTGAEIESSQLSLRDSDVRGDDIGVKITGDSRAYFYDSLVVGKTISGVLSQLIEQQEQTQSVYGYNSRFSGNLFSVATVTGTDAYFHGCFFSGGAVSGTGNETCSMSTDGSFAAYTSTCP